MKSLKVLVCLSLAYLFFTPAHAAQPPDIKGSKDHQLLSRLPGYTISQYVAKDFERYTSPYIEKDNVWSGALTQIGYTARDDAGKQYGFAQIVNNYENALKKLGGTILYTDDTRVVGRVEQDGRVTNIEVSAYNEGRNYQLLTVEQKVMKDEVVVDAAALNRNIVDTGKVIVYGIYFDSGKAVIKPESAPTLDQMAKLLHQNTGLKLIVVGHTDSDGNYAGNMKLSADRAAAVVAALTAKGISTGRLTSAGVGPNCPVASNRTDAGKAKNRRVELVDLAN